jgi:hypothetical protein
MLPAGETRPVPCGQFTAPLFPAGGAPRTAVPAAGATRSSRLHSAGTTGWSLYCSCGRCAVSCAIGVTTASGDLAGAVRAATILTHRTGRQHFLPGSCRIRGAEVTTPCEAPTFHQSSVQQCRCPWPRTGSIRTRRQAACPAAPDTRSSVSICLADLGIVASDTVLGTLPARLVVALWPELRDVVREHEENCPGK